MIQQKLPTKHAVAVDEFENGLETTHWQFDQVAGTMIDQIIQIVEVQ